MSLIEIDGSYGEGGGQIVRSSLTLSAVTQKPFHIYNIRLHRSPKPKLQPQHLMAAQAVATITNGKLDGAYKDSDAFTFYPNKIAAGDYEFDIGTAGSAILVAQTIIPILLQADDESHVRIIGGTHLTKSPGYDYFFYVFLNAIAKLNANIKCNLLRSGFYPKGNGCIEFVVQPSQLRGYQFATSNQKTRALVRIANLPMHIAEREQMILQSHGIMDIDICEEQTLSPGNVVTIWNGYCGSSELGRRGVRAEEVAENAYQQFVKETADVDFHLADQLLIYAILANGASRYQTSFISNHFLTNQFVCAKFIERAVVVADEDTVIID